MPGDPYAEFGGSQVTSAPITNQDPYAEFGGRSAAPPQVQQTPNFGSRVGNRILQNLNIPAQLNALKGGINEALANPKLRTGGRLPEVWQSLKQNYSDPANIVGDLLGGAMGGDVVQLVGRQAPQRPQLTAPQSQQAIPPAPAPRLTPPTVEPDIEMQMRLGTTNPPEPAPIKGVGNKLGTPAEQVRVQQAMEGRGAAKQALESGPKQLTAGTAAGAASDTALFQQAKAENPGGSVSDWAKRAQELKTATLQKQLAAKPNPYASKSAPSMESVQSTNINKVGHDGSNMWVEYKSGQVYRYKDVPKDVFQQAKGADSVGSYIARNVKGKYETSLRGTVK